MSEESARPRRDAAETEQLQLERVVFFSDAVYAIAITLLVIDIRLPETAAELTTQGLLQGLDELWPRIFAYLLSVAVIGSYWLAHWRRFRVIERADDRLAAINLLLLGSIAFLPFPTALIGEHGDVPLVVAIYALSLSLAGLLGALSLIYAARAGLTTPGIPATWYRVWASRGLTIPAVMLISILLLAAGVPTTAIELAWAPAIILIQVAIAYIVSGHPSVPSH
jgi:uncharacterized membrane protein